MFSDDKILKESIHYIYIASKNIDSFMKIDKKNYSEVYLEECKYKIKKKKMVKFIDSELDPGDFDYCNDSDDSNSE